MWLTILYREVVTCKQSLMFCVAVVDCASVLGVLGVLGVMSDAWEMGWMDALVDGWMWTCRDGMLLYVSQSLHRDVMTLLDDAHEDFKSLHNIATKMNQWKKDFPDSYRDVFVSLSLPSIFAPFVRYALPSLSLFLHSLSLDTLYLGFVSG
jgi:hypothetical protein